MKKAFITGISGQDGSYLAEYLLSLGYEVYGLIRRKAVCEHQTTNLESVLDRVDLRYGDMTDLAFLFKSLKEIQPDEIYNLAAQSHVRISFDVPHYTLETNGVGILNLLEAYRQVCPDARLYQASSSEMFGNSIDEDGYQRESTPMHPVSPYGCSKLLAYSLVRNYRKAYNLFSCNGILFNHESIRRGLNFVTNKISKTAVEIKLGLKQKLELGNLEASRDWGHSKDYVKAMHLILNHSEPDDFVVATGESNTVRYLCEYVFGKLNLDYKEYVQVNEKFLRPEELHCLKGDSSKIRQKLNWIPYYTIETILDEMIEHWVQMYK